MPVDLRNQAGLQLGLALVVVLVVLLLAGLALNFATAQYARSTLVRDRIGIALLVALALVPVGVVAKLALADGGLGSSVSRNWKSLTDPNAAIPIILFLKTVFFGKSKVLREASAAFRKQVDYLVWGILAMVAFALVYSIGSLIHSFWK